MQSCQGKYIYRVLRSEEVGVLQGQGNEQYGEVDLVKWGLYYKEYIGYNMFEFCFKSSENLQKKF